jgi:hypothetical protein
MLNERLARFMVTPHFHGFPVFTGSGDLSGLDNSTIWRTKLSGQYLFLCLDAATDMPPFHPRSIRTLLTADIRGGRRGGGSIRCYLDLPSSSKLGFR